MVGSDELPKALARDWREAALSEADRAMLSYAVKLTRNPHAVSQHDVDALLDAGFDETAVLDVCQVVSYYNYVNRLADGLGVELEDEWADEDLILDREAFEERAAQGSDGADARV